MTTRLVLRTVIDRLDRTGLLRSAPPTRDVELRGIQDDSRAVEGGELFCAWLGTSVDAHEYVAAAEEAGAVAALVERRVPDAGLPQILVADGRRAAAHAAMAVYGDPVDELLLVGVTGTNGKTTTVWLLRHLLEARYASATIGTLGVGLRSGAAPGEAGPVLTTPGPVGLARILRQLVDRGIRAVAMEVSSHALDQGRVDAMVFDVAAFTNLTRDHLDYHGDREAYLAAKARLADRLRDDGVLVLNADESAWSDLGRRAEHVIRYGVHAAEADVRAAGLRIEAGGAAFRLETPAGAADVRLPLVGGFNVANALAAAATGSALGYDAEELAERLTSVPQVPGRLERIASSPCPVLRDYAHSPDALTRVLEALRPLVDGRVIVVFGAGGDRDRGKRPEMGAVAAELADVVVVTSDNPRTEDPDAIIDEIVGGMPRAADIREVDRRRAIARALGLARPDDVVLLAGKGHETYQTIGTRTVPFDEREVVRALLDSAREEVDA